MTTMTTMIMLIEIMAILCNLTRDTKKKGREESQTETRKKSMKTSTGKANESHSPPQTIPTLN